MVWLSCTDTIVCYLLDYERIMVLTAEIFLLKFVVYCIIICCYTTFVLK